MSDIVDRIWACPAKMWPRFFVKVDDGAEIYGPGDNPALVAHTQISVRVTGGKSVVNVGFGITDENIKPFYINGSISTGNLHEFHFFAYKNSEFVSHDVSIFQSVQSVYGTCKSRPENSTLHVSFKFQGEHRDLQMNWFITFKPEELPDDRAQRKESQRVELNELIELKRKEHERYRMIEFKVKWLKMKREVLQKTKKFFLQRDERIKSELKREKQFKRLQKRICLYHKWKLDGLLEQMRMKVRR